MNLNRRNKADEFYDFCCSMASKNQLMVLLLLFNKGPLTVDEIRDITGLKQSSVSNYLRCLSFSNVVFFKEMGRHHFYEFFGEL